MCKGNEKYLIAAVLTVVVLLTIGYLRKRTAHRVLIIATGSWTPTLHAEPLNSLIPVLLKIWKTVLGIIPMKDFHCPKCLKNRPFIW